ncbi:MAG: hypothetical protein D6816_10665 [Bacteroidetes bacterium]|nr:MAG: hypothetical protein D6816_10665 [Bacteroidota bacterium]
MRVLDATEKVSTELRESLRTAGIPIDALLRMLHIERATFYRWVRGDNAANELHLNVMKRVLAVLNELIDAGKLPTENKYASTRVFTTALRERGFYDWFGGV